MSNSPDSALRIIFAGTPEFAATSLAALCDSTHDVIAVFTQPDRPSGRGRRVTSSPVKQMAENQGIPVFQPQTLKEPDVQQSLIELNPDLIVVAAYGLLVPEFVLNLPRLGCVNIHASLLPRWRGAAPIQYALLNGDLVTGISLMQMDAGLDSGDILCQQSCSVQDSDTSSLLLARLATIGAELLIGSLPHLEQIQQSAEPQDLSQVTYAPKVKKSAAEINWGKSAIEIDRLIRAFESWPVAYSQINGERCRIWQASICSDQIVGSPGAIVASDGSGIKVACGTGILNIEKLQMPGGRVMASGELLNARQRAFMVGANFI